MPPSAPEAVNFGESRFKRAQQTIAHQSRAKATFSRITFTIAPMVELATPLSLADGLNATGTCVYA